LLESIQAARTIPEPRLSGIMWGLALANLSYIPALRGQLDLAAEQSAEALERLAGAGHDWGETLVLVQLAGYVREQGDFRRALGLLRRGLDLIREHPGTHHIIAVIRSLAITSIVAGQTERGMRLVGATDSDRERIGLQYSAGTDQAALERALKTARSSLGESAFDAARAAGRQMQFDQMLAEASAVFDEPIASEVEADAAQPAAVASLSPRELEVLALLVEGHTNPAIAKELFISARTVENHIAHIFTKLGVSTRTAAVAIAISEGIRPSGDVRAS
jgi:DNA-binding NarL/FixJ family response regulator